MAGLKIPGYENLRQIGKGGFSRVYRGEQSKLKRRVAIKVLNFGLNDEADRHSFERECELMGRVSTHPNIVTVHDTAFTSDGQPCIVMEHYPGGSLADLIGEVRQLNPKEVLEVGVSIASALEASHQAGVLHCDLKPQNILISEFGQPALGDFGISTFTEERTRTGGDAGAGFTLAYAAPEIVEGASPSVQSDLYSLAATLYTSLAGRRPFYYPNANGTKPTAAEQARRILLEQPSALTEVGVPTELDQLVRGVMSKEPSERPNSAADFAWSLHRAGQQLGFGTSSPRIADQGALPVFEPSGEFTDQSGNSPVAEHSILAPAPAPDMPAAPAPLAEAAAAAPVELSVAEDDLTEARPAPAPQALSNDEATQVRSAPTFVGFDGRESSAPATRAGGELASPPAPSRPETPPSTPPAEVSEPATAVRRRRTATVVGALSLLVVGVIIYLVASSGGTSDTAQVTPVATASVAISNVALAPPAPRDVTITRVGSDSVLVAWSSTVADDVTYEIRRRNDLSTVWATSDESPVLISGLAPTDEPCIEVVADRAGRLAPSASRPCVRPLGATYIQATPAECKDPCQVTIDLVGFEPLDQLEFSASTLGGADVTSDVAELSSVFTVVDAASSTGFLAEFEPGTYLIAATLQSSGEVFQTGIVVSEPGDS